MKRSTNQNGASSSSSQCKTGYMPMRRMSKASIRAARRMKCANRVYEINRYFAILLNIVFGTVGLGIIGASAGLYFNKTVLHLATTFHNVVNLHAMIAGSMVMSLIYIGIAIFGIYSLVKKSIDLYGISACVTFVLIMLQISLMYSTRNEIDEKVTIGFLMAVMQYGAGKSYVNTQYIDIFQQWMSCCGASGPSDYARINDVMKQYVPLSCCDVDKQLNDTSCMQAVVQINNKYGSADGIPIFYAFQHGCFTEFEEKFWSRYLTFGLTMLVFQVCILLSPVSLLTLHNHLVKQEEIIQAEEDNLRAVMNLGVAISGTGIKRSIMKTSTSSSVKRRSVSQVDCHICDVCNERIACEAAFSHSDNVGSCSFNQHKCAKNAKPETCV